MARTLVKTINKVDDLGSAPYIKREEVTAPFTTIQNRAKVSTSMQAILGNERIHVNSIKQLANEFGPNGEKVYQDDKGDSRIRFIGQFQTVFSNWGSYIESVNSTNGVTEITFYGTGLNLLMIIDGNTRDFNVSIDGGASIGFNSNGSAVIGNRNYKSNTVKNIASGLSLGWHTIQIQSISTLSILLYGFEILNEASQITVKGGTAFSAGKEITISDQTIDYNLGFDNIADIDVGTKGGRAVIYVDPEDSQLKKRFTKVDITAQYLSSADHSNEAMYRRINYREFGRFRGDDFKANVSNNDLAFTLDDGTTTLVGDNINTINNIGTYVVTAGGSITLTFTGTGLDIYCGREDANIPNEPYEVFVDGSSIGSTNFSNGDINNATFKVCSGLPYGTHTVKLVRTAAVASTQYFQDFIVYQPKKPLLPQNSINIAEYNIMADFVQDTTTNPSNISIGVVRKDASRESMYVGGSWSLATAFPTVGGWRAATTSNTDYVEYTFFGTGFHKRAFAPTSNIEEIQIDGQLLTASNFPSATVFNHSEYSYNSGTGEFTASSSGVFGSGYGVTGLPLGMHTIRMTKKSGTNIYWSAIDFISPIHSPHTTFGSMSMKDLRNFDSNKEINKSLVPKLNMTGYVNGLNNTILSSTNVSQVFEQATGVWVFFFEEPFDGFESYVPSIGGTTGNQEYMNIQVPVGNRPFLKHLVALRTDNPHTGANVERSVVPISVTGILEKDRLEE